MADDSAMILESFFTADDMSCLHSSFRKFAICNNFDCDGISRNYNENCMILVPMKIDESLKQCMEEKIKSWTNSLSESEINYECEKCSSLINDDKISRHDIKCKTEYNDLLIINVQYSNENREIAPNLEISKDIPDEICINDENYDLILFVDKTGYHYKTFFKNDKKYIILDDMSRCEELIDSEKIGYGVNPCILFYYKRPENIPIVDSVEYSKPHIHENDAKMKESSNSVSTAVEDFEKIENEIILNDQLMKEITKPEKIDEELHEEVDQYQEEFMLLKDFTADDILNKNGETDVIIGMNKPKSNVKVIAPGQGRKPVSSRKILNYHELCFPKAYGGYGMTFDRKRISQGKVSKAEIKNYKRNRNRNKMLFLKAKDKILDSLGGSIRIFMRKVKRKRMKITARNVRDGTYLNKIIGEDIAYRLLPSIRSGPMYLRKKKNHALAMIRQVGSPQIFLTLSFGENYSPELLKQMKKNLTGEDISLLDALNMNISDKTKYVREDPISCAEVFNHKVNKLGTYAGDTKGHGLFREHYVTHFIKRKEAQGRGTMHSHQILWLKDAPVLNPYEEDVNKRELNEQEVVAFIDKVITTKYRENHPNMHFHIHNCGEVCYKGNKGMIKKCRFNFPHFVSPKTKVIYPMPKKEVTNDMANNLKRIQERMKRYRNTVETQSFQDMLKDLKLTEEQYYLAVRCAYKRVDIMYKRESNAVGINTYIETLFHTWESNHDAQYIPDPYGFVHYLSKYCLKADEAMLHMMKKTEEECRNGNKTLIETLQKVSNVFHGSSLITAQQAVEELEGFPILKFSHAEKFINTNRPDDRVYLQKSFEQLKKMDDDDENITVPDFINEYSKRPESLKDVCLADFAALYKRKGEIEKVSDCEESDDDDNENRPKRISREYALRTKEKIIRYVNFKVEQKEKEYIREMVMLFHPWRDEEKELLSYEDVRITFFENTESILKKYAHYNSLNMTDLERLVKEVDENLKPERDTEVENFINMEKNEAFIPKIDVFKELGINSKENDDIFSKDSTGPYAITRPTKIDKDELYQDMRKLNDLQQQFVQHIFHGIKTKKDHEIHPKILLLGPAGTGKSLVLKTINQLLTHYYDNICGENLEIPKVLLAAYTGIAAFLIGGMTCHSAFGLKVGFKGKSLDSDSTKNSIRSAHREIKAIIIDELSFISRETRAQIDINCKKIYGNDHESFGGKLVIFMGDLFQLAPVCGRPIYKTIDTMKKKKSNPNNLMKELTTDAVWKEFKLFELTEIVRQKDSNYQKALTNLARGKMTDNDLSLINKRVFQNEDDVPKDAIRLFYSNEEVRSYNEKKIHQMEGDLYEIEAIDQIKGDKLDPTRKNSLLNDYLDDNVPSVNMKSKVLIKNGIKYMILVNLDVADGLVNGAFGKLEHITFTEKNDKKEVLLLWINFNNSKIGNTARMPYIDYMKAKNIPMHLVPISKITLDMTSGKRNQLSCKILHEAFRTQFPVRPCEALTIHKVQGLTLSKVCLDLRYLKRDLSTDLKYVALSRCDFNGLYILGEFKKSSDSSANDVIKEIERLRKEAPLELSYYNFQQDAGKKIIYHNVRSFNAHKNDIKSTNWYWEADLIILTETNVVHVDNSEIRENFDILYPTIDDVIEKERSRGLIILCKKNEVVKNLSSPNIIQGVTTLGEKWHIDMRTFEIANHYVITGYKSPKTPYMAFKNEIVALLDRAPIDSYITIMGDFNFNMFNENSFRKLLEERKFFNRLGDSKTTDANTQIDIVYSTSSDGIAGNFASYFSDHYAIYYQTEFDHNQVLKITTNSEQNINNNPICEDIEMKNCCEIDEDVDMRPIIPNGVNLPDRLISVVFKNNIDASYQGKEINFYSLCPFNSIVHGFIALAQYNSSFLEIVQKNTNISFYGFIQGILNDTVVNKNQNWIDFILLCCSDIIDIAPLRLGKNSLNMSNDVVEILNKFFVNHNSLSIESSKCTNMIQNSNEDNLSVCNGYSPPLNFNIITILEVLPNLRLTLAHDIYNTARKWTHQCQECKDKVIHGGYTRIFGDLLIINLASTYDGKSIKFSDLLFRIVMNLEIYELKLFFDHPVDHFFSVLIMDKDNYLILDDVSGQKILNQVEMEKIIQNVKVLIYLKAKKTAKKNMKRSMMDSQESISDQDIINSSPKRARTNNVLNNRVKKYALIPNTIMYKNQGIELTYKFLCTFNSFLHGFIASFKLFCNFDIYLNENREIFTYFDIVLKLIQSQSSDNRNKQWMSYIAENVQITEQEDYSRGVYPFKIEEENNYERIHNMTWNQESMIDSFLSNFISYTIDFNCDTCGYNRSKKIRSQFLTVINNQEDTRKYDEKVQSIITEKINAYHISCINCKHELKGYCYPNEVMIFSCRMYHPEINTETKIPLNEIPTTITVAEKDYNLLFLINYQSGIHFNTFVNSAGTFIYLDDLPQTETLINHEILSNWTVDPCIFVFMRS